VLADVKLAGQRHLLASSPESRVTEGLVAGVAGCGANDASVGWGGGEAMPPHREVWRAQGTPALLCFPDADMRAQSQTCSRFRFHTHTRAHTHTHTHTKTHTHTHIQRVPSAHTCMGGVRPLLTGA
jgi:hypothetical protein